MLIKISIIVLASLVLGGCTLQDVLKTNSAVTDQQEEIVATPTPDPFMMAPTSTSTDTDSLEADLNSTMILEEDFSDLN